MHYFTVHTPLVGAAGGIGSRHRVWKRFWRLHQAGVFELFFERLASLSRTAHLVPIFDSTVVRAHVPAAGAKGPRPRPLPRRFSHNDLVAAEAWCSD